MFPGERVERLGCWGSPGRRKPKLWALLTCPQHVGRKHFVSSLSERHGSTNGHGTAQEIACLNGGDFLRAFPYPLRRSPSSGHAASTQNADYVREAEEAALLKSAAECHIPFAPTYNLIYLYEAIAAEGVGNSLGGHDA